MNEDTKKKLNRIQELLKEKETIEKELEKLYSERGWSVRFSYDFHRAHCIELS